MTRLGEPKCLYGGKLARLGGWPYHRKSVNRLGGVSHANSSSFVRKCMKSWLAQGNWGRRATLLADVFLHIKGGSHLTGILITGYYNHNTQRAFTVIPRTVRYTLDFDDQFHKCERLIPFYSTLHSGWHTSVDY